MLQHEVNKISDQMMAAHECGHAVCALAHGVEVVKIQNGLRNQFTLYRSSFPTQVVRHIVCMAGAVAQCNFLDPLGIKAIVYCSAGDAAHLLGHQESNEHDVSAKLRICNAYDKNSQVARLQASLNDHFGDGKDLPNEFEHLRGLITQARNTLWEHRDLHGDLMSALSDKGGVLRKGDIQRIWEARAIRQLGVSDRHNGEASQVAAQMLA